MQIIDLSLLIRDGLQSYPSHPPIRIAPHNTFEETAPRYTPPCQGFSSKMISISDHGGTHVDAPVHFVPGGASITDQPLGRHMGPGVLLDVSSKPASQPVTGAMLEQAERAAGVRVGEGDIVLIRCWPGQWGDPGFLEAAALAADAADWLLARKVRAVGLDLGNVDTGRDMARPVHMKLLPAGMPVYENLCNLDKLPPRFFFIGLPLRLEGATASPVRAVALVGEPWTSLTGVSDASGSAAGGR
ncbi:cyclase family protein [Caldinitratiruptor microaerophilus]|uniref:Cyclase n=1 Tax=Caldinitratiruptor microaerophilus TaxID=671077 RepID=A0AA35G7G4_9FIRM|nr:cyclase family protein [Caldinitratiruptor microaerophilus]BDG59840.1 cyclase [Caldinitratiruptor microaerophilus]